MALNERVYDTEISSAERSTWHKIYQIDADLITSGKVDGDGTFDKFMQSMNAQLAAQLKAGRITQSDFANVYTAVLQSTLSEAINFELSRQRAEKEAGLVAQQILNAGREHDKLDAEIAVLERQEEKVQNETQLIYYKRRTEQAQTADLIGNDTVAGVVGKQIDLLEAQEQGYKRDAEQKAAKIFADILAIKMRDEVLSASELNNYGFGLDDYAKVMQPLRENIGN